MDGSWVKFQDMEDWIEANGPCPIKRNMLYVVHKHMLETVLGFLVTQEGQHQFVPRDNNGRKDYSNSSAVQASLDKAHAYVRDLGFCPERWPRIYSTSVSQILIGWGIFGCMDFGNFYEKCQKYVCQFDLNVYIHFQICGNWHLYLMKLKSDWQTPFCHFSQKLPKSIQPIYLTQLKSDSGLVIFGPWVKFSFLGLNFHSLGHSLLIPRYENIVQVSF